MMFALVLLIPPILWLAGFLWATDFSIPLKDPRAFHHVLAIFPHADDEAVTCGGLLNRLSRAGQTVTLVLLTKGERGTPDASLDETLKNIRVNEARAAARTLGIAKIIQEDFGDGALQEKQPELAAFIERTIAQEQPDLLLTYDRSGFTGHPDHVVCSAIVTDVQRQQFPWIPLWYATFPRRILARIRLPGPVAAIPRAQSLPTQRIFIGASVFAKIAAWYAYKSQRASLRQGIRKLLPIWFFLSLVLYEYVAEAKSDHRRSEDHSSG
jgi:LmbE family N-acetylglucosaminyl deacetylase